MNPTYKLGELVEFEDGDRGSNYPKQKEFFRDGYCLFLNTSNLPSEKFNFSELQFISEEKDSKLRKGKLRPNDFVLTTRGTVGHFAFYSEDVPFKNIRINSGMVLLRSKSDKLFPKFLKYILSSPAFKSRVNAYSTGSAQPQLPIRDLTSIVITLPDYEYQSKIYSIISAYDELIDNNEKRIKILEGMAQRLYTEWFVRFKFPGYEKVKMVDTPLGKIPEGWEVKIVKDLYRTSSGGTPSRRNESEFYVNGTIPWIKTQELNNRYILEPEEKITNLGLKKSSAKLFPINTVIIAMYGATIGKLGILSEESTTNQACCAFVMKEQTFSSYYIFQFLKENVKKLTSLAFGGAQPNVSQTTIGNLPILRPTDGILNEYNKKSQLVFNEILILQKQIMNLSKTRDLLIPQLVTGKRKLN